MIKVGTVSAYDKKRDMARVYLPAEGIVSAWLRVIRQRPQDRIQQQAEGQANINSAESGSISIDGVSGSSADSPKVPIYIEGNSAQKNKSTATFEDEGIITLGDRLMWIPKVGTSVLCAFTDEGEGDGFILGCLSWEGVL